MKSDMQIYLIELKEKINEYIEFKSNSLMYKELSSEDDFKGILENTDIMTCISEELKATNFRVEIENIITTIENLFKEVQSYELLFTALRNHYLSLNINEQIAPVSSKFDDNSEELEDEVGFTSDNISVQKVPDNSDLYGAEFLKG